jgi:hypothetical protein
MCGGGFAGWIIAVMNGPAVRALGVPLRLPESRWYFVINADEFLPGWTL